ncbi:MAG: tetratricopeptide repeat protein, partial [Planctomycetota bacterium]
ASAARALGWARVARKHGVDMAQELETALMRDFPQAVPDAAAIQAELEARIGSEKAKVDGVHRMQVPAEFFLPEGAADAEGRSALDAAYALYEREDYAAALDAFFPLAKAGDVEAAFYVGRIHEMGYVGRPNGPVAERWYVRAAEAGIHAATANLGYMYLEGRGVPKSPSRATDYFLLAAYGGNLEGAVNVGFAYGTGQGREKDVVEAHAWYSIGAEQGGESAASNRAILEREMSPEEIAAAGRRRSTLEAELRGEARPAKALPMLGSKRSRLPVANPDSATTDRVAPETAPAKRPEAGWKAPSEIASSERIEIYDDVLGGMESHGVALPEGWSFDAGLSWNPRDAIAHANVEGVAFLPTGAEVQFLPSGSFTYYTDVQMPGAPARPAEGDYTGGAMFLDPGAGPEDFVKRVVLPSYRASAVDVRITEVTEAPAVSQVYAELMAPMVEQMTANAAQPGVEVTHSVTCPLIRASYTVGGRAMEEEISFLYARFDMKMDMGGGQSMMSTLWYVLDTRSLRAPAGQLDSLRPTMRRIATSLRPTQAWAATIDHIRATFYGNPETFQALQSMDHGTAVERIKAHAAPLGKQRDELIEKATQNWNELQSNLKRLEDAWEETLQASAPPRKRGGFRLR